MIFVVSTVFLAVGASLTFGFTAAVVMPVVSVFVPAVVAYGGIAAGVLILLLSISGYSGICCKKRCESPCGGGRSPRRPRQGG